MNIVFQDMTRREKVTDYILLDDGDGEKLDRAMENIKCFDTLILSNWDDEDIAAGAEERKVFMRLKKENAVKFLGKLLEVLS